ncbi:MAG: hypothetical protein WCC60_20030 [Ilumatobacteraceae bacterium]
MSTPPPDELELAPSLLPLAQLRALRAELQHEDDAISYVRRLAQARLDLLRAELHHRSVGDMKNITGELPAILGTHLTGGSPRPPRPADDFSDHPMALALEELCNDAGSTDLPSMSGDELIDYLAKLHEFEQLRSHERKALFVRIDALSAELVRRYRDGEADVDGLLAQD